MASAAPSHSEEPAQSLTTAMAFPEPPPVPAWKRPLDLFLIGLALPVLLPVMATIAAWVKLVSRGSIFFVQERVGYGGQRFGCLKFRTMHQGACTSSHEQHLRQVLNGNGPMEKLDAADPRLIPGARLIRAIGFDELPQLLNVVWGEMSLIGPRPCTPFELQRYEPHQLERFSALPGLTGLWQVSGKNETSFAQMVALDVDYLRRPSLVRDLTIVLLTPKTLVHQLRKMIASRRGKTAAVIPFPAPPAGERLGAKV